MGGYRDRRVDPLEARRAQLAREIPLAHRAAAFLAGGLVAVITAAAHYTLPTRKGRRADH